MGRRSNQSLEAYYTQGYWNPLRLKIAKKLLEFPIVPGPEPGMIMHGPNKAGEEFNYGRLAKELGCSYFMVNWMDHAIAFGAVVPSDEEFASASVKGLEIPLKPETARPKINVIELARENLAKEPPISRSQMQNNVNKFVESIESGRPIKLQPEAPQDKLPLIPPQTPPQDKKNGDQPVTQEKKEWHETPPPSSPQEQPQKPQAEAQPIEKEKGQGQKIVSAGGTYFESVHKIRLSLISMIWFTYCQIQYGYDGSIDDFINWCILDCIKARGLSLEVIEKPFELIGTGIKQSMQQQEGGPYGGATT